MRDYYSTDPEFMECFEHFAFDEVINEEGQTLEEPLRHMAVLAALLGCQGIDEFRLRRNDLKYVRLRRTPKFLISNS